MTAGLGQSEHVLYAKNCHAAAIMELLRRLNIPQEHVKLEEQSAPYHVQSGVHTSGGLAAPEWHAPEPQP